MSWYWLNVPLMVVFSLATAGIPMWLVLRHPDGRADATPQSAPVLVATTAQVGRVLVRS
jgi:hypothetical protein